MSKFNTYASFIKIWLLLCGLTFAASRSSAQVASVRAAVANAASDTQRINALMDAGKFYMYKPGEPWPTWTAHSIL